MGKQYPSGTTRAAPWHVSKLTRNRLAVRSAALVLAVPALLLSGAAPSHAVAPGCTAARPTAVGGAIYGYPDNRSLNAMVGIDLTANGVNVNPDGSPNSTGGYATVDNVNQTTLTSEGTDAPGFDRTWGANGSTAHLCVAATVDVVFLEVYPRNYDPTRSPSVYTDKTRYGAAAHYRQPITSGATNSITLRLPLRDELGGNTGYINGYLTFNGRPIPDPNNPGDTSHIEVIRVWPRGNGPDCGVEGFSAGADALGLSGSGTATFYRVDAIAGERCGATSQAYRLDVSCICGGVKYLQSRDVSIRDGVGIRVDISF